MESDELDSEPDILPKQLRFELSGSAFSTPASEKEDEIYTDDIHMVDALPRISPRSHIKDTLEIAQRVSKTKLLLQSAIAPLPQQEMQVSSSPRNEFNFREPLIPLERAASVDLESPSQPQLSVSPRRPLRDSVDHPVFAPPKEVLEPDSSCNNLSASRPLSEIIAPVLTSKLSCTKPLSAARISPVSRLASPVSSLIQSCVEREKILHLELDSSDSVVCAEEADSHTADSLLSDVAMQVDTTNSGPVKLKKSGLEHPCSMVFKTLPPKEKTPEREESRSLSPDNSSSNSKFTTPESSSVVSLQTARSRLSAESNASFSLSISLHSANSPTRDSSLQVAAATVVTSVPNVSEVAIASSTISSTCSTASQQSHTENQSLDSTLSLPSESPSPACLQTVSSTNGTPVSPVSCYYSPSKETLQIPDKSVMSNDSFVSRRSQGSVCQSPCQSIRASTPEGSPVSVATKESPSLVPQDDLPSPVMHIVEDAKSDTSKTNTAQGIKPFFSTDGSSVSSTTDLKEVYLEFANEKTISPQLQIEEEKNTELEDATIVMQVNTSPLYLRLKSQNSSPTTANSENLEMLIVKDASYESQEKMLSQKHISESEAYVEQHIEKEMSHCGTFVSTSSEKAPLSDESVKFNKHKKSDCMKKTTEPEAPQPMDTEVYNITEKSVKAMDITPPETPKKRENKSSSTRGTTEKSTRQMPRLIPVTSPNTKFVSKTRSKLRIASPEGNKSRAEIRSPSPHHTVTPKTLTGSTDSPKQAAKSSPTVVVASPVHTYNTRLHSSSPESRPSLGLKDAERPEARSTLEKKLPEFKEKSSMKSARRPVTRACMSSSKKKMDIASVKPAYSPGQQKIEFSFSPPTTVSTDRVTDDHPLTPVESKPFIFSPPLTRSRSRRGKRLSETDIVSSETTVGTTDDGGISTTRTLDGSKKRVAGRKSVTRSRRMMHSPEAVGSDSPINFVSPAAFNKEGKSTSSVRRSQRSLLQEAPQRRPAVFGHSRKKAYIW